jgi:AcrR family transcriptional regulator
MDSAEGIIESVQDGLRSRRRQHGAGWQRTASAAPDPAGDTPMSKVRKSRGRPSSREAMLDAAQDVVLQEGAGRLTLDAVAKRAGVSKGGVMYNFPTKEALLKAMVERVVEHNRQAHASVTASLPEQPGRSLQAYVMNSVRALDLDDQVSGALLAALNGDRTLMAPVAEYFTGRFRLLAEDVPFEQAALVYLATEGLWAQELLQVSPFSPRQRAQLVRMLLRMAEPGAAPVVAAAESQLKVRAKADPKARSGAKSKSGNKGKS